MKLTFQLSVPLDSKGGNHWSVSAVERNLLKMKNTAQVWKSMQLRGKMD